MRSPRAIDSGDFPQAPSRRAVIARPAIFIARFSPADTTLIDIRCIAMFKEELPTAVYEELDRRGLNGVPVLLCTTSELSLSGRPERNWIVATRNNVAAVREATVMRGSPDPASTADRRSPN